MPTESWFIHCSSLIQLCVCIHVYLCTCASVQGIFGSLSRPRHRKGREQLEISSNLAMSWNWTSYPDMRFLRLRGNSREKSQHVTKKSKATSLLSSGSQSSNELLQIMKLKDVITDEDEEYLNSVYGWLFICFLLFGMILFHFFHFRICSGFLGAFFVYLNRQVVLCIRRHTALSQFLTK